MSKEVKKTTLTVEIMMTFIASELLKSTRHNYRLRFYSPTEGLRLPIKIYDDRSIELLTETDTLSLLKSRAKPIYESLSSSHKKADLLLLSAHNAKAVFKTLMITPEMQLRETVKTFAFKSDESLAFQRIPFDLITTPSLMPNFDRLLNNFSNVEALKMWVGSLFVAGSDRSQYLWLYGKGGNGKSTLALIIYKALKKFAIFEHAPMKEDKYWTFGLLGKRLVILDDCNNYGFVKTGLFKAATGTGRVRVEQKYGDPHDADLDCKFLFTSNETPMVSNEIADQRRLIFCAAKNQEQFNFSADFFSNLESELPNFISNCVIAYEAACADGRPVPVDQTEALEMGDVFNEEIEAWVNTHFDYDQFSHVEVSKFRAELGKTKLNPRRVYAYLADQGVTRKVARYGSGLSKILPGIKQKIFTFNTYSEK